MRHRHALVAAVVLCCSCGSIVAPGPDKLDVTSDPSGATVFVRGVPAGKTPMQLQIERATDEREFCSVAFQLEGFHTQTVEIKKVLNGWVWANFLFLLFPGAVMALVDIGTGNWVKVPEGDPMHIVMVPTSRPAPPPLRFPFPESPTSHPAPTGQWQPPGGP
jgi:hypothetical protein